MILKSETLIDLTEIISANLENTNNFPMVNIDLNKLFYMIYHNILYKSSIIMIYIVLL